MKIKRYTRDSQDMPAALRRAISAGGEAPAAFLGDPRILRGRLIGFFCSIRCPGDPILKTYDLARALRDTYLTIVGGFQSPMEKELPAPAVAGILRGSVRLSGPRGLAGCAYPKDMESGTR